ncbi:chemotaxis protein CheD [Aliiroseovarius crassostreae]|uniref:chemotaxis protein CheD n=1 Tax=Aliiroseovarius crassostreae TaxID=154981 RepID=UPI003C7BCDCB
MKHSIPASTSQSRVYISQGEFAIETGHDAIIATLLGSCVSACIWDETRKIGGMNHVLFSDDTENAQAVFGHGVNGMELLINGLLQRGASRKNLRSKVFGGARMIEGLSDAGLRNGEFVIDFLNREGIEYVGGDLGGDKARRLEFWPGNGRARQKLIAKDVPLVKPVRRQSNEVELF